jgi:DNA helicase-2/ATP-dependent DNA helicase PcrA
VLAFLRLAENPRGPLPDFVFAVAAGVGPKTAARPRQRSPQPTIRLGHCSMQAPAGRAEEWGGFVNSYFSLRTTSPGWPAELELVNRWYEPHLVRRHENAEARQGDLRQLEAIAAAFPSRERFLTELTLDPPGATSDEAGVPRQDEDYLILSTIHSAKGQEWRAVYVLSAVDGCIPSDMATGTPHRL